MTGRRANMRHSAKRDGNEAEIVNVLEGGGFCVDRINGTGIPDLLVGKCARMWLIEVKRRGKGLTPAQIAWRARWRGPAPITLRSVEEALTWIRRALALAGDVPSDGAKLEER